MSGAQEEDHKEPDYPALNAVTVVDSRLGSRRELIKDLKATALFERVVEAKSLAHGLLTLHIEDVDSCMIGPSLRSDKALQFLESAKQIPTAEVCAFVVVRNEGSNSEKEFERVGVHNIIRRPYTKEVFREKVVQSVIKANANSEWAKIAQARLADGQTLGQTEQAVQDEEGDLPNRLALTAVFRDTLPRLKDIVVGHQDGQYGLLIDGRPTPRTSAAIRELIEEILDSQELSPEERIYMANYLDTAIRDWFVDVVLRSEGIATAKLRKKLIDFVTGR